MAARLALAALMLAAASALAQPADALADRLAGNTISVTNRFGTLKLRLHRDGAYDYALPDGRVNRGSWRTLNAALCTTAIDPAPPPGAPAENCLRIRDRPVGGSWTVNDPRNGPIRFKIGRGI